MKNLGIVFASLLTITCYAQKSTSLLLNSLNTTNDVTSCYQASPAIALNAQPNQILFQSTDGGTTWVDLSKGLPDGTDANAIYAKEGDLYLGTRDGKLYRSNDPQSAIWEEQNIEGRTTPGFINGIFSGKSGTYACFLQEGFYKQIAGTNNWKPMHENLKNKEMYDVLETTDGTLFVGCSTGIYRSTDEGKTWKHIFTEGWINDFNYSSNVILASSGKGIQRSTDGGEHWNCVLEDVGGYYDVSTIDGYFVAFREAPVWSGSISQHMQFVSVSTDGITWHPMETGKPADTRIYDLEKMGDYLFSSRQGGISRSNDLGKNWQLLITPPLSENNNGFMVFELITSGTTLFALMRQGGC